MIISSVTLQIFNQEYHSDTSSKANAGDEFALFLKTAQSADSTEKSSASEKNSLITTGQIYLDTDKEKISMNIDAYFTPPANPVDLDSIPLLSPTPENIDTLSRHASSKLKNLLDDYDIPYAPATITYDETGHIQLPKDYAYADKFKQALNDNPSLERELSAINALTSHFVAIQQSLEFSKAYMAANSDSERDAIVSKYAYLFSNNRHYASIALSVSGDGTITPTADENFIMNYDINREIF